MDLLSIYSCICIDYRQYAPMSISIMEDYIGIDEEYYLCCVVCSLDLSGLWQRWFLKGSVRYYLVKLAGYYIMLLLWLVYDSLIIGLVLGFEVCLLFLYFIVT